MRVEDRSFRAIVSPDQRSHQGKGSWLLVGSLRIRRDVEGRNIGHGYHLVYWHEDDRTKQEAVTHEPQILIGASNSSKIGWLMNISRAFVHKYLISYSCSWTGLPGRFPRTEREGRRLSESRFRKSMYNSCGSV
jgi:hypothetical protein